MRSQEELQALLCDNILGSPNAYFQPPANVQMKYPAIVYVLKGIDTIRADNEKVMEAIEKALAEKGYIASEI